MKGKYFANDFTSYLKGTLYDYASDMRDHQWLYMGASTPGDYHTSNSTYYQCSCDSVVVMSAKANHNRADITAQLQVRYCRHYTANFSV